ncbi:hypothetical protein H0H93_006666 [Arthromyces matolae]|nr:hypothetical protein H0H93_006666 [Arthromyces matolae]
MNRFADIDNNRSLSRGREAFPTQEDRSRSRGREVFSSGRGGAGNIRQASQSREARPSDGPDDFSITRGREPVSGIRSVEEAQETSILHPETHRLKESTAEIFKILIYPFFRHSFTNPSL